jgi:hypothetical protein
LTLVSICLTLRYWVKLHDRRAKPDSDTL